MDLQRQNRKRLADAMRPADLDSPGWKSRPEAIRIAPEVRVDSILRLIPPNGYRAPGHSVVAAPAQFPKPGRDLRKLRAAPLWKTGTLDEKVAQMEQWFPDLPDVFIEGAAPKRKKKRSMKKSISRPSAPPKDPLRRGICPTSDIGTFAKLPGELRNRIYRMAVIEPDTENTYDLGYTRQPVKFVMEPGTCSTGMCLHSKVSYNVPGIANTCRQMRWEVMPIFCHENVAFQFDDMMVHQSCVGNFLRSIGDYADLVPEYRFLLKRPLWDRNEFMCWTTYYFSLTSPKKTDNENDDLFELDYDEDMARKICACPLDKVVDDMNDVWVDDTKKRPAIGKMVLRYAESEEFSDFVWRMRKSKQWMHALDKCEDCDNVKFNN